MESSSDENGSFLVNSRRPLKNKARILDSEASSDEEQSFISMKSTASKVSTRRNVISSDSESDGDDYGPSSSVKDQNNSKRQQSSDLLTDDSDGDEQQSLEGVSNDNDEISNELSVMSINQSPNISNGSLSAGMNDTSLKSINYGSPSLAKSFMNNSSFESPVSDSPKSIHSSSLKNANNESKSERSINENTVDSVVEESFDVSHIEGERSKSKSKIFDSEDDEVESSIVVSKPSKPSKLGRRSVRFGNPEDMNG